MELTQYLPFFLIFFIALISLAAIYYALLGRKGVKLNGDKRFPRQMIFLVIVFLAIWVVVLFLPIEASARGELSAILGIIFSALVALSSTSILSNLIAGIVLRVTQPFTIGDFVRIDTYFGRVSERGLLDTELQTEDRAFVSIPNAYLIKHPISSINASGTAVSVTLSLGYDIHHKRIEPLLIAAAEKAALEKPFVHILALGDFSVTYRIAGFLEQTKHYLSVKSHLFACVLDELHGNDIEILSPNYMAQRPTDPTVPAIPKAILDDYSSAVKHQAESVIFDKAEKAENIARFRNQLNNDIEVLTQQQKETENASEKEKITNRIQDKETLLAQLNTLEEDE